jgi:TetR/AcrR family transcriptional regulator, cholesterol catabolism regulator
MVQLLLERNGNQISNNAGENLVTSSSTRKIRSLVKDRKLLNGRRDTLAEVAIGLFAAKGFDNVTVDDIAKSAHMSKGTIYNYIGCKEDFVFLILDNVNTDFYNKVKKNLKEHNAVKWTDVLREYMRAYLEMVNRKQDALNFLNHVVIGLDREKKKLVNATQTERSNEFEMILVKGNKAGEFKVDDPKLMSYNIVRVLTSWASNNVLLCKFINFDEYMEKEIKFLLDGMGIENVSE